jgi:acyl-CoA dehydrogenase
MNILPYTDDHEKFRKRFADFLQQEAVPHLDRWEKDRIVPRSIWKRMGAEGFLCTDVAKEYGGLGGDFLYSVIIAEELARVNQNGIGASLHSDIVVPYIRSFGSEEQKQRYLPGCVAGDIITAVAMTEPDAGSDLAGMTSTAEEEGDTILLNGSKTFISSGINCDLVVVAAKDPAVADPYQAMSLFLVEAGTPGFQKGRQLEKMGLHSQDTAELYFSNCRIPAGNRLGEKGMGFLMLMEKLQQERLMVAIMAVTAAEYILRWITGHCRENGVSGKPLSKSQSVQFALVEMQTEVKLGRTFMETLIVDHMAARNVVIETAMAKYWTTDMVQRVGNRALELIGPAAFDNSCPVVKAWRDIRIMTVFAGTNEIMKNIAAKFMGL